MGDGSFVGIVSSVPTLNNEQYNGFYSYVGGYSNLGTLSVALATVVRGNAARRQWYIAVPCQPTRQVALMMLMLMRACATNREADHHANMTTLVNSTGALQPRPYEPDLVPNFNAP